MFCNWSSLRDMGTKFFTAKKAWLTVLPWAVLCADSAHAALIDYFKNEDGSTKWQYVANFSSSVLILLLSITVVTLLLSHRRERRANRALQELTNVLEQRVMKRTATLNESNQLLQQSKLALEGEINQHKETMQRLEVSEAYIKSILDSMPLMLIGLNHEMKITQWNNWAESTTGISSDGALGRNLWEAYPTITLSPDQVQEVLNEKKSITIKHSQRGQYYFDITVYALQSSSETGIVILVDDITQQSKAENMLIQRDKMSSMGELAATMAHDINTPLQAILDSLKVVKEKVKVNGADPVISSKVNDAEENGIQAFAIINNLMHFSRGFSDDKEPADIPHIIDHTIELANSLLSDSSGLKFKNIAIKKQYEQGLPAIPCYESELQQVFLSLFRHACHSLGKVEHSGFTPTIAIDVNEFYDSLWIKIQHNGRGLSGEEQQIIFEPFFFGSSNGPMGEMENRLSFSYFIINEHHRGNMAVTSDVDIGSTFHIQLQLR